MILYTRGRPRLAVTAAALATFLLGCFVFGVLSVRNTTPGLLLIGVTFCFVLYWIKPQLMVSIALFVAVAALPQGLPPGKAVGPLMIYGHHVPLLLAICYLLPMVRRRMSVFALPGIFALTVVYFAVVGLATGHAPTVVIRETSFLLEMVGGFMLAQLIVYVGYLKESIRTIAVTLWISAGLVVMSSLHLIQLTGRVESLQESTGAAEAIRVGTNTQTPAIAALTALVAAQVIGRVRPTLYLALGAPALVISLLSFSRNTVLSVAVAAAVAFLTSIGWTALRRTAVFVALSAVVVAAAVPATLFLLQHSPAGQWLADQLTAFNHRVLGGISTRALAVDESTLDRLREDAELNRAILQAPVFGHGLGYAYQPPAPWAQLDTTDNFGQFAATFGTTYSHNFYLWWLCKSGAVGMASFAAFALTPLIRALRCASAPAKISAAVSAGLLAVSIVDPLPEEAVNALTLGVALGSAMAFASLRRGETVSGDPAPALTGVSQ